MERTVRLAPLFAHIAPRLEGAAEDEFIHLILDRTHDGYEGCVDDACPASVVLRSPSPSPSRIISELRARLDAGRTVFAGKRKRSYADVPRITVTSTRPADAEFDDEINAIVECARVVLDVPECVRGEAAGIREFPHLTIGLWTPRRFVAEVWYGPHLDAPGIEVERDTSDDALAALSARMRGLYGERRRELEELFACADRAIARGAAAGPTASR